MKNIILLTVILAAFTWPGSKGAPYSLKCAEGDISGCATVNKFGNNGDIDANVEEDILSMGGTLHTYTAHSIIKFVSASAFDSIGNAGADTMTIFGLDSNFDLITEDIQLGGTDTISSVNNYWFLYRMFVKNAGDSAKNVGIIKAEHDIDNATVIQINAGINQTLFAAYQVPRNTDFYLDHIWMSMNKSNTTGATDMKFYVKPFGGVFQLKHLKGVQAAGSSNAPQVFDPMLKVDAKSIMKLGAVPTANNTNISAGFDGYLLDK